MARTAGGIGASFDKYGQSMDELGRQLGNNLGSIGEVIGKLESMGDLGRRLGNQFGGIGESIARSVEQSTASIGRARPPAHAGTSDFPTECPPKSWLGHVDVDQRRTFSAGGLYVGAVDENSAPQDNVHHGDARAKRHQEKLEAKLKRNVEREQARLHRHHRHHAHAAAKQDKVMHEMSSKLEKHLTKAMHKFDKAAKSKDLDPALLATVREKSANALARHTASLQDAVQPQPQPAATPSPPSSSAVYRSAKLGDIAQLRHFLTSTEGGVRGAIEFVDADDHRRTPLQAAACNGHTDCVRLLLDVGANHLATDDLGNSALHLACTFGHVQVVALVLSHPLRPATPCALNNAGQTAYDVAAVELASKMQATKTAGATPSWAPIAACLEALEERLKVFEGWVLVEGDEASNTQLHQRYAVVLRTASDQSLALHIHRVEHQLRHPLPSLTTTVDVHNPMPPTRKRSSVGAAPWSFSAGMLCLAAFNEAGFVAWTHFLTAQAVSAARDPVAHRLAVPPPPVPAKSLDLHQLDMPAHQTPASAPDMSNPPVSSKDVSFIRSSPSPPIAPSAPPLGNAQVAEGGECIVCFDRPKETVCVPCGHVAACVRCADTIQSTTHQCPVCRGDIREVVKLFLT